MSILRKFVLLVIMPVMLAGAVLGQARGARGKNVAEGIVFLGMFESPSDVNDGRTPCQRLRDLFDGSDEAREINVEKPAVCDKVVDVIAGKAQASPENADSPVRAAKIATDSHGRIIITEPGTRSVHVLDFANRKYSRIDGGENDRMDFPYAVAVDAKDKVYVTDQRQGRIAVFSAGGKFERYIGDFKGEHAFERPSGIAIERASGRIYLADAVRQFVLIYDLKGKKLASIGRRGGGSGAGEFRIPTDVALHGKELFVLDQRNSRIQVLDLDGRYKREFATALGAGAPKGMAIDSKGLIYILLDVGLVEVFGAKGERLFRFGHYGTGAGEFKDASGIYIDSADRVFVSDTGNRRVQVFEIRQQF